MILSFKRQKNFVGAVPIKLHIPRLDGGHIRIRSKNRKIQNFKLEI